MAPNDSGGQPPDRRGRAVATILQWTVGLLLLAAAVLFLWGAAYVGRNWPTAFVGVVLLAGCWALVPDVLMQVRLRRRGVPAEGVVENVRSKMRATGGPGAKLMYTARVRFRDRDGVERTCHVGARHTTSPGQRFLVYYDSRQPSRAGRRDSLVFLLFRIVLLLAWLGGAGWFVVWISAGGRFD